MGKAGLIGRRFNTIISWTIAWTNLFPSTGSSKAIAPTESFRENYPFSCIFPFIHSHFPRKCKNKVASSHSQSRRIR